MLTFVQNLYVYKNNIFWIIKKDTNGIIEISKQKFNHEIYFHDTELKNDLISVIKVSNVLIMLFKDRIVNKKLDNCEMIEELNLGRINNNLVNFVFNGLYYNSTDDTIYLFSLDKPLSYTKIKYFTTRPFYEEKPIQLFKLDKYDYDKVFEFEEFAFFG